MDYLHDKKHEGKFTLCMISFFQFLFLQKHTVRTFGGHIPVNPGSASDLGYPSIDGLSGMLVSQFSNLYLELSYGTLVKTRSSRGKQLKRRIPLYVKEL